MYFLKHKKKKGNKHKTNGMDMYGVSNLMGHMQFQKSLLSSGWVPHKPFI